MQRVLTVNSCLKTKVKVWIVDVNLSVHLSTYCQNMVNIYSSVITSNSKSLPKLAIIKIAPKEIQIRPGIGITFFSMCQMAPSI